MDCFSWLYECFTQLVNSLGLLVLFLVGFKCLKSSCRFWNEVKNGFCLEVVSCKCGLVNLVRFLSQPIMERLEESKQNVAYSYHDHKEDGDFFDERQVMDEMTLRKVVKKERAKVKAANIELEKERMAAITAAEEAMAMILRLQNEKSMIQMEADHYRRLAEKKQQHDGEVIQSLQWIIMKHESERRVLEEHLSLYSQKLKVYIKNGDQGDHFDEFWGLSNADFEDDLYH